MPEASEWDEVLFRRSLADLAQRPPADGEALQQFQQYWVQSLDHAEASGVLTGVARDVFLADLRAAARALPGVRVVEYESGASLRVPFTKQQD